MIGVALASNDSGGGNVHANFFHWSILFSSRDKPLNNQEEPNPSTTMRFSPTPHVSIAAIAVALCHHFRLQRFRPSQRPFRPTNGD
jgi:hypothetical protein